MNAWTEQRVSTLTPRVRPLSARADDGDHRKGWGFGRHVALAAAFLTLALGGAYAGSVKIIANPSLKAESVTAEELKNVFLEETSSLRDGSHVEPVLQKAATARDVFSKEYLGQSAAEVRTYYLGLVFTGKGSVPKEFGSDAEVVAYVARTRGAIGYVSVATSVEGVKTLVVVPAGRNGERVLLTRIEPEYPEVLQKLLVGGTVRLRLVIAPNGGVEEATLIGGNPILGEAAIASVKKWVYAAAPSRTTTEVTIPFNPKP